MSLFHRWDPLAGGCVPTSPNRMRCGVEPEKPRATSTHLVFIFFFYRTKHTYQLLSNKERFPLKSAKGPSEMDIPFSREQEQQERCLCPFNLYLRLWSWAKAYVSNNGGVRKHMSNNSAVQLRSNVGTALQAAPRHKAVYNYLAYEERAQPGPLFWRQNTWSSI